jgi:phosphatidate cytidylyltransferase
MLRTRLWMGGLLIAGFVGVVWVDAKIQAPYPCWLAFVVVLVMAACRELRALLKRRDLKPASWICYSSLLALILSNWVPWLMVRLELPAAPHGAARLACLSAVFCIVVMVTMVREMLAYRAPGQAVASAAAALLLCSYLGFLGSLAVELRWMEEGVWAIAFTVAAAKSGDSGAYFGGRLFGRHKLAPLVSPGKTIEGAVCGAVGSVLGSLGIAALSNAINSRVLVAWPAVCVFGVLIGVVATLGDLVESMIKRDCQQKDASDALPGFGGVLDVLDSILFSAPVAVLVWAVAGPGWPPEH